MSYKRLVELDGLQWPCPTEDHPGSPLLHDRLWRDPIGGAPAPFMPVEFEPPVDTLSDDFPLRLTTGRRLDSFNTGVQTGGYNSPLRLGETIDLAPEDGARLGVAEGERVRILSRRGQVEAPVRYEPADDRRDRSQVGHRGIQGVGDPDRKDLSGPAPDSRCDRHA
jgi:predicted molibdopterin-dependent oxidoreductase YjgC